MKNIDTNSPIQSLRNLGPKSSRWLQDVGINTISDLKEVGAVIAFKMVQEIQPNVSLNLLWALVAGLKGQDWREISEEEKMSLLKKIF